MEKAYLPKLKTLSEVCANMPKTRMMALGKLHALIALNMRYEKLMVDRNLATHPYILTEQLVDDAISAVRGWADISFIEQQSDNVVAQDPAAMEQLHHDLF